MVRRLIRMKALEGGRLQGRLVVALDGTGHVSFARPHCPQCLVQHAGRQDVYLHLVLEAKVVGLGGLALSIGTEFIENAARADGAGESDAPPRKQDCELAAFHRLADRLKREFPQTPLCVSADALYACGTGIQLAKEHGWSYVFTLKPDHTPTVWAEFQSLLRLCPENTLRVRLPDGTHQVYRWVTDLSYEDSAHRLHVFNALQCEETVAGKTTTFAWITDLPVTAATVASIATKGGRLRWKIENEGFNLQKTSELNLEHAYSTDPENLKAYYYLLQIAHIMLQLLERGSLLRRLAREVGKTPQTLFGSLKNIARRLLECFRYGLLPEEDATRRAAAAIQIRLDTS
jgi:hypothetical protein